MTRRVAVYHEVLLSIRGSKHRGRGELVLKSLETFLTFVCPVKLDTFVKQICQRLGNLGEVLDKSAAIAGEAEETSDLLDSLGRVQSRIAWIRSGVTATPSLEITCPR